MKTFAVYILAVFSGLVLLGGLRGIFSPTPTGMARDAGTLSGYWVTTAILLVVGAVGLSFSLKWIRKQKKSSQSPNPQKR